MLIIPVIDLYAGSVVHAIAGQRESYKKIRTPLCHGSDPLIVVDALLCLYHFTTLYIADLDAIKEKGNNNEIIDELLHLHPNICIWLDAGKSVYSTSLPKTRFRHIVGTETGIDERELLEINSGTNTILSLDFSEQEFIGQQSLLENTHTWPDDIIVMSLNRVGTDKGPDTDRLSQVQSLAEHKCVYAAGGVRNDNDLELLHVQGIAGVLIASALHKGKLSKQALRKYSVI